MMLINYHGYLKTNAYKSFKNYIRPEFSETDAHEIQIFLHFKRLAEFFSTFLIKVSNTFSALALVNLWQDKTML